MSVVFVLDVAKQYDIFVCVKFASGVLVSACAGF